MTSDGISSDVLRVVGIENIRISVSPYMKPSFVTLYKSSADQNPYIRDRTLGKSVDRLHVFDSRIRDLRYLNMSPTRGR